MIYPKVLDAVESIAEIIINAKCDGHLFPETATLVEIQQEFNTQLLEAMRELCRSRGFAGSKTLNGTPMVSFKNNPL